MKKIIVSTIFMVILFLSCKNEDPVPSFGSFNNQVISGYEGDTISISGINLDILDRYSIYFVKGNTKFVGGAISYSDEEGAIIVPDDLPMVDLQFEIGLGNDGTVTEMTNLVFQTIPPVVERVEPNFSSRLLESPIVLKGKNLKRSRLYVTSIHKSDEVEWFGYGSVISFTDTSLTYRPNAWFGSAQLRLYDVLFADYEDYKGYPDQYTFEKILSDTLFYVAYYTFPRDQEIKQGESLLFRAATTSDLTAYLDDFELDYSFRWLTDSLTNYTFNVPEEVPAGQYRFFVKDGNGKNLIDRVSENTYTPDVTVSNK